MKKKDEGFTLIELLIVIVILGILATVVVFAVSGIRDKGDASACATERRTLETAIEAYYAQNNGEWPESAEDLVGIGGDALLRSDTVYLDTDGNGNIEAKAGVTLPDDCLTPGGGGDGDGDGD